MTAMDVFKVMMPAILLGLVDAIKSPEPTCPTEGFYQQMHFSTDECDDRVFDKVCRANDVKALTLTDFSEVANHCHVNGGTAKFTVTVQMESTAAERYDMGWFLKRAGGCDVITFPCDVANTDGDVAEDGAADLCGDIAQGVTEFTDVEIEVDCSSLDGGILTLDYCLVWDNEDGGGNGNGNNNQNQGVGRHRNANNYQTIKRVNGNANNNQESCTGPENVKAGTTAKCLCEENVQVCVAKDEGEACDGVEDTGCCSPYMCVADAYAATGFACGSDTCTMSGDPCTGDQDTSCCESLHCLEGEDGNFCCADPAAEGKGDPHLRGFKGQKFDFTGESGGHYALLSEEDPSMLLTMLLHAPVPDVPAITYIVGMAFQTADLEGDLHTLEIAVNEPGDFNAPRTCPADEPCLADGVLTVLLDGAPVISPGMVTAGPGFVFGAVNIPGECRPFGFENYWAEKVREAELAAAGNGRRLDLSGVSMAEWILADSLATNPADCERYVATAKEQGTLLQHQSEHVSFQIVTPAATIRLNHGKLHQVAMRDPTDQFDLPDHRTFQMNIGLERTSLGAFPKGVLGETVRPVIDSFGKPIMVGPSAMRGEEEDYRVSGPFNDDFGARLSSAKGMAS